MSNKKRWSDPANEGQPDWEKIGNRMFLIIMLLVAATIAKMAMANHWIDTFNQLFGF